MTMPSIISNWEQYQFFTLPEVNFDRIIAVCLSLTCSVSETASEEIDSLEIPTSRHLIGCDRRWLEWRVWNTVGADRREDFSIGLGCAETL